MGELEDRLERLAEHRAAQVPPFSMPPTDELAVRRDGRRRNRLVVAIAACLVIALVIGGLLLFSRKSNDHTVETPVGTLPSTVTAVARAGVRGQRGRRHGVGDHDDDGCGVGPHHRRSASGRVAITPDGKHAYVTDFVGGDGDTVSVITTATGAVSPPSPSGKDPFEVAITPDGKHAYVANVAMARCR